MAGETLVAGGPSTRHGRTAEIAASTRSERCGEISLLRPGRVNAPACTSHGWERFPPSS